MHQELCRRSEQCYQIVPTKATIIKPAFTEQIHNITIYSTPHRTLNTSRGIIRYKDEDCDDLSDDEICKELALQGVIQFTRCITKRNGPLVKLNTLQRMSHPIQ